MKPAPVGTRIRVLRNQFRHSYEIGRVYTVVQDDHDGTFKAADDAGKVGNWLRWEECEPAGPSLWQQIAADLPEDLVAFLSCFDGIRSLSLKEGVIDAVLAGIPDVHERAAVFARTPAGRALIADNLPTPVEPKESTR
jgi:hypothetical protein